MTEDKVLGLLGVALTYPDGNQLAAACVAAKVLAGPAPEAAKSIARFCDAVAAMTASETEELYTTTFDLNPVAAMEVGWHLFGENYERGRFLARLREQLDKHGIEEHGELPDHLTSLLPLLDRMPVAEGEPLAKHCVLPAIGKMLEPLGSSDNPYRFLLEGISAAVRLSFGIEAVTVAQRPAAEEHLSDATPY